MRKSLDELLKTVPNGTKFEEIATGPAVGLEDEEEVDENTKVLFVSNPMTSVDYRVRDSDTPGCS